MDGVKQHCPDMAPWAYWCLNGSSRVYYNARVINCTTGVQQGDPLGPVLFSMGLHTVIEKLLAIPEIRQLWFLDDGILRGQTSQVLHASTVMSNELAKINLRVHRHKCEI